MTEFLFAGREPAWLERKLGRMKVAVAVLGGVGLASSVAGGIASSKAADTQAQAAKDATDAANKTQMDMYQQTRTDQAPYREAGYTALGQIQKQIADGTGFAAPFNMSDFYSDPGYQFTKDQGTAAINNSASARGGVLNGGVLKAIGQYTTGLANQTYGDAYNRYLATNTNKFNQLATVAGLGQTAVNATQNATTNAANQISTNQYNGITSAGNARASGYVGIGNAINNGLSSIGTAGLLAGFGKKSGGSGGGFSPIGDPWGGGGSYGD